MANRAKPRTVSAAAISAGETSTPSRRPGPHLDRRERVDRQLPQRGQVVRLGRAHFGPELDNEEFLCRWLLQQARIRVHLEEKLVDTSIVQLTPVGLVVISVHVTQDVETGVVVVLE